MLKKTALDNFHPFIKEWFIKNIGTPSLPQEQGWPEIQAGKSVLISAPTGAGKTLAAFLECIDRLLKLGLDNNLPKGVFVLYISPLKALNNDIYKNLDVPLEGIKNVCEAHNQIFPEIRKAVRTGDTTQNERSKILKNPPQILITTPESLYLMLTSKKSAEILSNVHYVIVDEIHTMLGSKRGVHLAVSLERLQHIANRELIRIGLSATVNPIEAAANYLGGVGNNLPRPVTIVAPNMQRSKDLQIHMPVADYRALEKGTIWPEIFDSIQKLVKQHNSTIVFVNNRAVAEKVTASINTISDDIISRPHHGSMSRKKRLEIEDEFKNGRLKCIVATSTLELGIDVGSVDLMIQVAAPLSVSAGLQRLGRAGHRLSATSKGKIIPKTRGDLLKCAFISKEMLEGNIEKENIPMNSLDILSQQVVSMSCEKKWDEEEMLAVIRSAWSYKELPEKDFKKVLAMLSGDYEHMNDIPAKPRLFWDRQNRTIEGTAYSRMLAVNSGGTIPDRGYFTVYLEDYKTRIGELDEVFVFEARLGDQFMLGNSAWKILKIEKDRVIVAPGSSLSAKAPFWQGDGIGSPYEQGIAFGRYLYELSQKLETENFIPFILSSSFLDETAALNIKNYLSDQLEALSFLSHDRRIVVEYLKDDTIDQKIIIHAHFGSRVNSVLSMLFQKALEENIRCQVYTSHTNDAILIHIYGCPDHISDIFSFISPNRVESVLLEMLPKSSRFSMTFRYTAYRALMMGIRNIGQRLPLWIQRLRSVDAMDNAMKQLDHPLLLETMRECMEVIFDIPNSIKVLNSINNGEIEVSEVSTWYPSPFSSELLLEFQSFMMYMEESPHPGETRKNAISGIDALNLTYHRDDGKNPLSLDAVKEMSEKFRADTKLSQIKSPNELHSFLLIYGDVRVEEMIQHCSANQYVEELIEQNRVIILGNDSLPSCLYIAVEECGLYAAALPHLKIEIGKHQNSVTELSETWTTQAAVLRIIRRFCRYQSPFSSIAIAERYGFSSKSITLVLNQLIDEGLIKRVCFDKDSNDQFCHAKIYDAIIRKDGEIKANEVIARDSAVFASFLPEWQKVCTTGAGSETALYEVINQLQGLYLPVEHWESIVFPARMKAYSPALLDRMCATGRIFWRIRQDKNSKNMQLAWFTYEVTEVSSENVQASTVKNNRPEEAEGTLEENVVQVLKQKGACFTHVLSSLSGIQTSKLLEVLKSLVYKGLVVNDSFTSIRYFNREQIAKGKQDQSVQNARRIATLISKMQFGRWELAWNLADKPIREYQKLLFNRYGLICKETISAEETDITWQEAYEALKTIEYSGEVVRGYFIKGISGIQFMMPEAYKKLDNSRQYQVLNACDPSQAYGKIIPHSESPLLFTNIPSTALVLKCGKPVLVIERYGEKLNSMCNEEELEAAIREFVEIFKEGRIWNDKKRITVKYWPENAQEADVLKNILLKEGFVREVMKMVLWRQNR